MFSIRPKGFYQINPRPFIRCFRVFCRRSQKFLQQNQGHSPSWLIPALQDCDTALSKDYQLPTSKSSENKVIVNAFSQAQTLLPPPTVHTAVIESLLTDFSRTTPIGFLDAAVSLFCPSSVLNDDASRVFSLTERLSGLQWLGFLAHSLEYYGPPGRRAVEQLFHYVPEWSKGAASIAAKLSSQALALKIDEAVEAIATQGETLWEEDQQLLARCLYPVQTYRLIETNVENLTDIHLFCVTNFEASQLPQLAVEFFRLLGRPTREKNSAARFSISDPLEPYLNLFDQLRHKAQQFFCEYVLDEIRSEGSDPIQHLEAALRHREHCRRFSVLQRFLESPTYYHKRSVHRTRRRLAPGLPNTDSLRNIHVSEKLHERLCVDGDVFNEVIGQKLLNLATLHLLPCLRERQSHNDSMGDATAQRELLRQSHMIPPITTVAQAFGLSLTNRNPSITASSPDAQWRQLYLTDRGFGEPHEEPFFDLNRLPTMHVYEQILKTLPLPSRPYLAYLNFCVSPEDHLIRHWWTGMHWATDPIVRWKLNDRMTPETFASLQWCHSALRRCAMRLRQPIRALIVGTGAARLSWFLRLYLQFANEDGQIPEFIPAGVMNDTVSGDPVISTDSKKYLPYTYGLTGATGFPIHDVGSLPVLLDRYAPNCMPAGIDWSKHFRSCSNVKEYVLLGPKDSDASGHPFFTWGLNTFFEKPLLVQTAHYFVNHYEPAPYLRDGFQRFDIPEVTEQLLGSLDSAGNTCQRESPILNLFSYDVDCVFFSDNVGYFSATTFIRAS